MRVLSLLRLVIAVMIISWLLVTVFSQNPFTASFSAARVESLQKIVDGYAQEGRKTVQAYTSSVEAGLEKRLNLMFKQLDEDNNGMLSVAEFKKLSFSTIQSVLSADMPTIPKLPQLEVAEFLSELTFFSFVRGWITAQLLFLISLYMIEHLRVLIFGHPAASTFNLDNYKTKKPPHVGKERALYYDTPLTLYERLKIVFFCVTGLIVMRAVLAMVFFFTAIFFINMTVFKGRNRDKNPIWFWFFSRLSQLCSHLMMASYGFYRVHSVGKMASREEVKVIVGNHLCMMELVNAYIGYLFPSFVSRVENLSVPGFGGLVKTSNAILVDRSAADSRVKTITEIRRRALADKPESPQVMIFPEGTCANQLALFTFKRGAFDPGAPIQMICTRFPYQHFNICWTGRACGGCDALDLLVRLCCQFVNRMDVCYVPVYTPTNEEIEDPIQYAKHCQEMMANILGIATSDATFDDYTEAAKRYRLANKFQSPSRQTSRRSSPHPEHEMESAPSPAQKKMQ